MCITIDARGLSCPIPQQLTIKTIRNTEPGATITVLVDEAGARDTVIRTAQAVGLTCTMEKHADEYKIHIFRGKLWTEKR